MYQTTEYFNGNGNKKYPYLQPLQKDEEKPKGFFVSKSLVKTQTSNPDSHLKAKETSTKMVHKKGDSQLEDELKITRNLNFGLESDEQFKQELEYKDLMQVNIQIEQIMRKIEKNQKIDFSQFQPLVLIGLQSIMIEQIETKGIGKINSLTQCIYALDHIKYPEFEAREFLEKLANLRNQKINSKEDLEFYKMEEEIKKRQAAAKNLEKSFNLTHENFSKVLESRTLQIVKNAFDGVDKIYNVPMNTQGVQTILNEETFEGYVQTLLIKETKTQVLRFQDIIKEKD